MIQLISIINPQGLVFYLFKTENISNEIDLLNENLISTTNSDSFRTKNYEVYQICALGASEDEFGEVCKIIENRLDECMLEPQELKGLEGLDEKTGLSKEQNEIAKDLDQLLTAHVHSEIIKPTKQVLKFTKKVKKPKQKQELADSLDFSALESATERKIDTGEGFESNNKVKELTYKKSSASLFSFSIKITESSIEKPLETLHSHLVSKNIASQVAQELITKLKSRLLTSSKSILYPLDGLITTHLRALLSETLGLQTNLLHEIKSKSRLYTICFVGVNGVGKSTNLSKVAYFLISNNLKVLIAACDTFRSGAVEQVKIHAKNLNILKPGMVEVFDKGYGKDPSGICKMAMEYGSKQGFDVVLVDTAGRMQDNIPLLKALAKLTSENVMDKVVFVGEALVGNQAVCQLEKFNEGLKEFSTNKRQIDAIILSKFDTVDDKVGAAVSMTYVTGKPILFVGTGQTYTDLRRMNVETIVDALLSK